MGIARREALLPATLRLLERILEARTYGELKGIGGEVLDGTASYGAWPESNLPFTRFRIDEADPVLLTLAGMEAPGFEVLRGCCGGFQFHWRNDLARAFETEMPVLGRFTARLPREQTVMVEHFVLPMLVRHRVRKLWGWILLGPEEDAAADMACLRQAFTFQRAEDPCPTPTSSPGGQGRPQRGPAVLALATRRIRPFDPDERRQRHAR
ncbi:hypothetical protein Rumeso_01625 [Rubellimicrobium mesophilum DSM 19309]|uniref:Uncharacterized protein n=2 Tax=Rubellimicrobium TaxID=295418 RepID=A0A017HQ98_9RHOB|nr:hypothetical protein Rumeso_01625 [Rubellimicrobium mesophilum DSM 19309]